MERRPTIAVAQTVPVRGDVDANVDEHVRLARAAGDEGAAVVVFPELSLTGYELDLADDLAFAGDDARLARLRAVATSCETTLVVGAPARLGGRLHIGAFVLSPDGGVEVYTKRRLGAFGPDTNPGGRIPPPERTVFEPGNRDPIVPLGESTAAIAVCADTGDPEHASRAAGRGASLYLASMFVIPSDFDREATNLRASAKRHGMAVAFANFGGPSGGLPSGGRSRIWSSRGECIVTLEVSGAGVALAESRDGAWVGRTVGG